MKFKDFLIGIAVGFLGGYVTKTVINDKVKMHPELILNNVKRIVKKGGPISGSWIVMQAEQYEKNDWQYTVYKGGISRNNNDVTEQFEFIADAYTGTIISFEKIT